MTDFLKDDEANLEKSGGYVSNPTAGDVFVQQPLTNFGQRFLQNSNAFVSLRAFPNLPVERQADKYYIFDRDDYWRDEGEDAMKRADGAKTRGSGFKQSTDNFYCEVFGWHKWVTDRQITNQDMQIRLEESATRFVNSKLMIRRERQFNALYMTGGSWDTQTDNTNWGNASNDPIVDVDAEKDNIHSKTGLRPNKAIITRKAYTTLKNNEALLARVNGGATTVTPAEVTINMIKSVFELEEIYIMDSVFSAAKEGAANPAAGRGFIGGDAMLLYYAPNTVTLDEPTAGLQFSWTGYTGATPNGMRISRFRNDEHRAWKIEGEMAYDYKITGSDLGHFFNNVSAT